MLEAHAKEERRAHGSLSDVYLLMNSFSLRIALCNKPATTFNTRGVSALLRLYTHHIGSKYVVCNRKTCVRRLECLSGSSRSLWEGALCKGATDDGLVEEVEAPEHAQPILDHSLPVWYYQDISRQGSNALQDHCNHTGPLQGAKTLLKC